MRKIIVSEMISADGFFAGPMGEIDWHVVDKEFNEYARELLDSVDTIMFGRVTYGLMAKYWPTPAADENDPIIAGRMNGLEKIVFSKTLGSVEWNNSKLARDIRPEDIERMKRQEGRGIVVYGSGTIVSALARLGLVDEYRLIVNPVVLGSGKSLFRDLGERLKLRLIKTKRFRSGNVLLCYKPIS